MSYISALRKRDKIYVWERNDDKREVKIHDTPYYFFVKDPNGEHKSIFGDSLRKEVFNTSDEFQRAKGAYRNRGEEMFESDLAPELKLLSQLYYQVPATLPNVTFLDIEVDYDPTIGFSSTKNPYAPINAIAMYQLWENRMVLYAVPPKDQDWTADRLIREMQKDEPFPDDVVVDVHICKNELQIVLRLLEEIENSDVLCGWNSDFFDIPYIAKRVDLIQKSKFKELSFAGANLPKFRDVEMFGTKNETVDLSGRISVDYLALFKKYEMAERPSYKLESIAEEILPDLPKLEYQGTLHGLYKNDFAKFCRYNLRDTEILKGFEERLGYVALANEMVHLSTGQWTHVLGTLKLAELAINNYCNHELNLHFPDMGDTFGGSGIAGAFVLLPQVGKHERIGSVDLNSLYPAAIRSINISPEKIIGQFNEEVKACQEIANNSDVELTFVQEDGEEATGPASDWRAALKEMQWSVSGFGTVFDQREKGIIPSILEDWYATRKKYQAKMRAEKIAAKKAYYNRLQYVYKIKLNSLYGALTNAYFRYYDLRMGQSTTGTGRMILLHQCAETCKIIDGEYTLPDVKTIDKNGREQIGYSDKWSIIYGDTDSSYFSTHATTDEEAIEFADAIGQAVNASFPKYMRATFLCQPGFDDIMKTGREIVADHGIFVQKKRYILHIIDNEGEKTDKLKVMGLDTKKTTIPPAIGKRLNSFVGRLLKGEDWKIIAKDIVEYKRWVETTNDVMAIGLPKGIQKVEDYTKAWKKDNNTRLPGHTAAAIHYNVTRKEYGDNESIEITSGMKIKVFYLAQKHGQFKSIALPTDLENVPDWFTDNYTINREMHVERLIDNPLANIINAIGEKVPTARSLLVDDLLGF